MKTFYVCVVSLLFSIAGIAQNSVVLKLNLEKNKVYRIKSVSEQNITQTMGGMSQTSQVSSNSVISIKMVDGKPEFMIAEVRFDTIANNSNAMGKKINTSSANIGNFKSEDITEVVSFFMNRMSKNALFVKMNYSGKVLEIINLKPFSDIVLKDIDSIKVEGPMAPMVSSQLKSMVEEKALKTMVETITNYLPGKQIAVGEKWEASTSMTAGGMSFTNNSSYKLDGVSNNVATISSDANIVPASAEPMVMNGIKINYSELKGLSKMKLLVDAKTGMIQESTAKTSMSGNLGVDIPGNPMQIPMEVSGETKVIAIP